MMENNFSYWEKSTFFNYDVIIVGSGIVGLNAAIHCIKESPKLRIAILERGFLPSGASTKNAGFACFGSISELMTQEDQSTSNGLANLIEKRWKGLLKLRHILGDKTIDYQALGGYELFKKDDVQLATKCVSKIEHYNKMIAGIVGKNAFELDHKKIKSFGFNNVEALITNRYEGQIDTGKMMFALIRLAQQLGISIFNHCKVDSFESKNKLITIHTAEGSFIAKKLIVATNAFVKSLLPSIAIKPGRGQVLITKPIKNLKLQGTFHYDRGYYYFRNINDRILIGGGRNLNFEAEETTSFGLTKVVQTALYKLLEDVILPQQAVEIDYGWSGIMAFGDSLPPLIEEVVPNIFCATRCNGMGIAIGAQTGEDLAELVLKSL